MPRIVSESQVDAYAHCPDPYCDGSAQEQVPAVAREIGRTFREMGGGGNGLDNHIERSWTHVEWVDPEDVPCKTCGLNRELSKDPRPSYPNISGYAQNGLTSIKGTAYASGFTTKG